jgi:tetratricopeptide (TPR) repeat protein
MPDLSEIEPSMNELSNNAAEAEKSDPSTAIELYQQILKTDPLQIHAYDRLMVIYRQQKNYQKELSIINSGIKAFEKFYKEQSGKASKKISEISQKLNKAFHLVDKKGNSLYTPEPIDRWQKRKETVEKKMEKVEKKIGKVEKKRSKSSK